MSFLSSKYTFQNLLVLFLFVVGILGTFYYLYSKKEKNIPLVDDLPQQIEVEAAIVSNESIVEFISFNGSTQYLVNSTIRSHLTGYVQDIRFGMNQYIKKGALFCSIKTKEQDALQRIKKIDPSFPSSMQALPIKSNATGLITSMAIHAGDYVAEGEVLAVIKEPSSLQLIIHVPYEYHSKIKIGSSCEVLLPDHQKINVRISGILPSIDPSAQTQSYFVRLPNQKLPENLNVSVRVALSSSSEGAKTIPLSALQTDELEQQFWVMKIKNNRAYKIPVMPQTQNEHSIAILSDQIFIGDSVVSHGSYQLADSSLVSIH
jgi:multidrug efflux pump subunit AcrA (membrane-fusion protein)